MLFVDQPRSFSRQQSGSLSRDPSSSGGSPAAWALAAMASASTQLPTVGTSGPAQSHLALRRRTKTEVCEAFLAGLAARGHPGAGDVRFREAIHEHFRSLPTRYALDINLSSLDVLNHRRLLEAARADTSSISFQVRPVDVSASQSGSAALGTKRPSFASTEMLLLDQVCCCQGQSAGLTDHSHACIPTATSCTANGTTVVTATTSLWELAQRQGVAVPFAVCTARTPPPPRHLQQK